jgi:hypothetical protein
MSPVFLDAALVPKGWQPVAASTISMGTASGDGQPIHISLRWGRDWHGMEICRALVLTLAPYIAARGGMRCLWPGNHQEPRIVDSARLGRPSVDSWEPRIPGWARRQRLTIGPRSGRTENAESEMCFFWFSLRRNWLPDHQGQTSYSRWGAQPTNRVHGVQGITSDGGNKVSCRSGHQVRGVYSGVTLMQPGTAMCADASSAHRGRLASPREAWRRLTVGTSSKYLEG